MQDHIVISGLSKEYYTRTGTVHAVRGLSLSIKKGTAFGFLGPNGAGKTTTMKMLVGLASPTSGSMMIGGGSPNDLTVRAKIGFMPESPSFYLYLTGREFLEFIAGIFEIQDKAARIEEMLTLVNLASAADRQVRTYSKGMLQRLGLAQTLINDPECIFLDEPLDGLDPLGRAEIKEIFLKEKLKGKTIFLNSHILADVAEICDVVGIIDKSVLIVEGAPAEIAKGYRDLEDAFVHIINAERAKKPVHVE